jgi:hypothetical protein
VRGLALLVALLFLLVSLSAEAKKKKGGKKGKTPAGKVKSKGKGEALPPDEPESDEASSDEKPAPKPAIEEEAEEKKPPPPAPEPEEEAAAKKPPKPKPEPKAEAEGEGGLVALQIGVGGKALFRKLRWTDTTTLVPYSLSPGPEASVWFEAFPAAFASDSFAGNIGLYGHFNYGFGASSKSGTTTLTTKYRDWLAGLKVRIPFGTFIPYIMVGYGMQLFHLEPPAPDRPNFNYTFVQAGAGARIQIAPTIDVDIGGGYLHVLSPGRQAGEVESPPLYPRATALGFDVTLSIGVRFTNMIGIRVGGDFRQFGLATHWRSTDTGVAQAGGAEDRYFSGWGGLELVLDGVGGGAPGEGEGESPPPKPAKAKKPPPREVEPEESEAE